MKRWEWGIGIGIGVGIGNRDWDRGRDRDRESGAVGGQRAVIWLISPKMNVYKRGCEKMMTIFSQPLFSPYSISW